MCGIFFSISATGYVTPDDKTLAKLQARGPDSCETHQTSIQPSGRGNSKSTNPQEICLTFVATVLALRGGHIQKQPMIDEHTRSIFCWNGEAWKIGGQTFAGNDTHCVFQLLLAASKVSQTDASKEIIAVLTSISGPFSFVFYDAISCCVYYGRDRLGRRSQMRSSYSKNTLILSSVSSHISGTTVEVETSGIYRVALGTSTTLVPELVPWQDTTTAINRDLPPNAAAPLPIAISTVHDVKRELSKSLHMRITNIPAYPVESSDKLDRSAARVAILFSGGIDCTLLACLAHDVVPMEESIDLLNVTFFNPRIVAASSSKASNPYELCPDRVTGRSSFLEIQRVCPGRRWRFVAIDTPFSAVIEHRPLIVELMNPHNTEMDLSIAMALYFAARGRGYVQNPSTSLPLQDCEQTELYQTTARVLISGLGADELFAGYTRHSTAFVRGGYKALIDELELDFRRIGERNLGRDDRVTSHWGKEVRYPYLDEDFTRCILNLEIWQKCGFRASPAEETLDNIEPAKMLLRLLALELDLQCAARETKRAIQFGARTAKMEIGKGRRKGTDIVDLSAAVMMDSDRLKR